jgi:hypothetical protein
MPLHKAKSGCLHCFPEFAFLTPPQTARLPSDSLLGYELKAKLLTLKPSFLSKILSLADMGEGRVWIRLGRVKIDYLVHFTLAQT